MPIPLDVDCSPTEFFAVLQRDFEEGKVSSFALVVSYESTTREDETFVGAKHDEQQRLIPLLPLLTRVQERCYAQVGLGPQTMSVSGEPKGGGEATPQQESLPPRHKKIGES